MAAAESEALADQVREAQAAWDDAQKVKLLGQTRLMQTDPAMAVIGLEGFGLGLAWMIARWADLKAAIESIGHWTNIDLFWEAARLRGLDAAGLKDSSHDVFDWFCAAVWCVPRWRDAPLLVRFMQENRPAWWEGRYGENASWIREEAYALICNWIDQEIERLKALAEVRGEIEAASRAGAPIRAAVPADTATNRKMMQYLHKTESSFDRALRGLTGLQKERARAEKEASKPASRNEAKSGRSVDRKYFYPGSYVHIGDQQYCVEEDARGQIILTATITYPYPAAQDAAGPPDGAV
jgi:hypothetical protein